MNDDLLNDLKQFMFYDRPPQLNIPVEHRKKVVPICPPVCVPICPPVCVPVCPSVCVPNCPPACVPICPPNSEINKLPKINKKQVFTPHQKDTLFWCFYKIIHDELPDNINIAMEKT